MKQRRIAKPVERKPNWVLMCAYCHKQPHEISEYVFMAKEEGMTPEEFVKTCEGTYNEDANTFCCTSCFIKHGF